MGVICTVTTGWNLDTLSRGSTALATIIRCSPSGPTTSPTEETTVAVTVSRPSAPPLAEERIDCCANACRPHSSKPADNMRIKNLPRHITAPAALKWDCIPGEGSLPGGQMIYRQVGSVAFRYFGLRYFCTQRHAI